MTAAIFTSNLKKSYGQKEVLKGISLTVDPGTICALLGTNGAGKTTMVRILTTQIVPDAGRAAIMGHDVVRDADQIHQIIGLTGQFSALDDALSGKENLLFIASLCHKIAILERHIAHTAQNLQEKVCCFLLENRSALPTLSQRQIAQKLNTSPESLSRVLRKLTGTTSKRSGHDRSRMWLLPPKKEKGGADIPYLYR